MNGTSAGPLDSITELIERANGGDQEALTRLFTGLYAELHALARSRVHRNTPITLLDTTALLHESYLRLTKLGALKVTSRAHFLAYAARAMRSIIVDFGRQRLAERRAGGAPEVPLDTESAQSISSGEEEVLRVHEALEELAPVDQRIVRGVEMRYFCGLTEEDIAAALAVTTRTVPRG